MINTDWRKFFPHATPRKEQIEALDFIIKAFNSGKKYCIVEAPCGTGKSAIAITLGKLLESQNQSSYVITTQKILQEQYKNDFPFIANVSAKQNYVCKNRLGGLTCEFGLAIASILAKTPQDFNAYKGCCSYYAAKHQFQTSNISVTNLHYFLSHANLTAKTELKDIERRNLVVIDEAHNLENTVIDFASVEFTKYMVTDVFKIQWPAVSKMSMTQFVDWVIRVYTKKLDEMVVGLGTKIPKGTNELELTSKHSISIMKRISDLTREQQSLKSFVDNYDESDWIMTVSATQDTVSLKPIYARNYTQSKIFSYGDKVLLMSGTILSKKSYCTNSGINETEAEFLSLDSPFPAKNRPVFIVNAGSMSRKNIEVTLPNMISVIEQLLEHHKDEKGIIHCHSYSTAKYINDNIRDKRLLFHSSDDRADILNLHMITKEPTVLVSPSFTEGIDLYDEFSRFQIIVKIPFPYLGDNYIRTKMEKIPGWYDWQTVKTLVQASGRSVRSVDDSAITYVLDSDWNFFFKKTAYLFPRWFKNAIQK